MSVLGKLVRKAWEGHNLLNLTLELTYHCQLACQFCYNDRGLQGVPLSFEKYRELLEDARRRGCLYLTLTGGEPTRSPYFFEVGRLARDLGFCIRIKTHGTYRDSSLIDRIKRQLDPMVLDVSIHGSGTATHEALTRIPGSFELLLNSLREMRRAGLRVTLRCPVTRINEAEVEAIASLGDQLGYPVRFDPDIFPRDNGDRSPLELAPSGQGILRLYRFLAASARPDQAGFPDEDTPGNHLPDSGYNCGAGTGALTVDPYGSVLPCVAWRIPVGNLWESRLAAIWDSLVLAEVRHENRSAGELYASGKPTGGLPFCPGRAHQDTGHATRLSPALVQLSGLYHTAKESVR